MMGDPLAPHAEGHDTTESFRTEDGSTVVYDPEFPEWHLTH